MSVYPKVKVRQEPLEYDTDVRDLGLKAFLSLFSPVMGKKNVIVRSIVEVPKCYVPNVPSPQVNVTEDFLDCSLSSESSETEKDSNNDEVRLHIRAGPNLRPRAIISSPDNDILIGHKNKTRDGRLSATTNGAALQNRRVHLKVKSYEVTDTPPDTRKSKEPDSNGKIDPIRKKNVHKVSIKSEKVPKSWKF
ncbi:PREDICTED: uncharacterized protein LOC109335192 isoform X1 [Lupinus angustifolius]|uniref:uncharacterized protein LOC109335192 isoform X1 n=1 Tax=Lupinus angustifolius TaxID=3871 RepID=UPI00092E4E59|nr:PREDICTED: uncharacterized protein LOC109335192 isoform X1 [Lupinus angustifolius]